MLPEKIRKHSPEITVNNPQSILECNPFGEVWVDGKDLRSKESKSGTIIALLVPLPQIRLPLGCARRDQEMHYI
jgi:hypothetical protein